MSDQTETVIDNSTKLIIEFNKKPTKYFPDGRLEEIFIRYWSKEDFVRDFVEKLDEACDGGRGMFMMGVPGTLPIPFFTDDFIDEGGNTDLPAVYTLEEYFDFRCPVIEKV